MSGTSSICATASVLIALLTMASQAVAKSQFNDTDKLEFVVTHNRLRQSASPPAAKMNFVVWDSHLESLATKAAHTCKNDHNYGGDYKGLGENIYGGSNFNATQLTYAWFSEKFCYNHTSRGCSYRSCGHYTQVMTDAVQKIGCGIQKCGGHHLVFCEYSAGNGFYSYGAPCSACPMDRPMCWNDMCVTKEIVSSSEAKAFDSIAASTTSCELDCNCGTLAHKDANCTCMCPPTLASGTYCEKRKEGSKCPICNGHLQCLNGGREQEVTTDSGQKICRCSCTADFVGSQCEIDKKIFSNSVRLEIGAEKVYIRMNYHVYLPVSKAKFNTKVWPVVKTALVTAVNAYCLNSSDIFTSCCPHIKTYPGKDKSLNLISEDDVKYLESTVASNFAGSIIFMTYSQISNNNKSLCPGDDTKYLPQSVLTAAIKASSGDLQKKLKECCDDTMKEFRNSAAADLEDACLYWKNDALKRSECYKVPDGIPGQPKATDSGNTGSKPKSSSSNILSNMTLILIVSCAAAIFLL